MIEWAEPWGNYDAPCFVRVTKKDAIAQQKYNASLKNHVYASDEEALIDFIVVNWATVVEGNNFDKV